MKLNFNEDFLHYIWRIKYFDTEDLRTTTGLPLSIRIFGNYNRDAGPDFIDAKAEIAGNVWFGHIEIHVLASQWRLHGHDADPKYQNVILHVVYEEDQPIYRSDGSRLPCLKLKGRISKRALQNYQSLKKTASWIPCANQIHCVPKSIFQIAKASFLADRLECRAHTLMDNYSCTEKDFLELIYQRLAWAFGLVANADAFKALAQSLPYSIVCRQKDHLLQTEALLFGQSGLLPSVGDHPYVSALISEYKFFKNKFDLRPLSPVQWKFMRMRPASFPTIRIAQFARLIHKLDRIDNILFDLDSDHPHTLFEVVASDFWNTHFRFGLSSPHSSVKRIGRSKIDAILINVCAPLLFGYGVLRKVENYKKMAVDLLYSLPPETNRIIRKWKKLGFSPENAADTQSLLELKKSKCDQFGCLKCPIGHHLIHKT